MISPSVIKIRKISKSRPRSLRSVVATISERAGLGHSHEKRRLDSSKQYSKVWVVGQPIYRTCIENDSWSYCHVTFSANVKNAGIDDRPLRTTSQDGSSARAWLLSSRRCSGRMNLEPGHHGSGGRPSSQGFRRLYAFLFLALVKRSFHTNRASLRFPAKDAEQPIKAMTALGGSKDMRPTVRTLPWNHRISF
jgi:hypothetical protein